MLLRLICLDQSLENGPGYLLAGAKYRVGRSSKCAFVINELSVSRHHAEIAVTHDGLCVRDLSSRNGTFVDGARVDQGNAKPGQMVRFGNAQFKVVGHETFVTEECENSEISTAYIDERPALQRKAVEQLSNAQRRVLTQLLKGMGDKETAAILNLSVNTVHNHVTAIFRKLGVNSRTELLAMFVSDEQKPPLAEK